MVFLFSSDWLLLASLFFFFVVASQKDSKDRRSYLLDGELSGLLGADRVNLASLSPLLNKHMRLELKDPQEISTAKKGTRES